MGNKADNSDDFHFCQKKLRPFFDRALQMFHDHNIEWINKLNVNFFKDPIRKSWRMRNTPGSLIMDHHWLWSQDHKVLNVELNSFTQYYVNTFISVQLIHVNKYFCLKYEHLTEQKVNLEFSSVVILIFCFVLCSSTSCNRPAKW